MSTLIVYMSRHSTTKKVAEIVKRGLKDNHIVSVDIGTEKVPSVDEFDTIIIGGSIHAGQIQKKIKNFCKSNITTLLNKKLGLFLCYMEITKAQEQFVNNFDEELRNHALATGLMGGEFLFEKMNFIEKFLVKKIAGVKISVSKLKTNEINKFIERLNA